MEFIMIRSLLVTLPLFISLAACKSAEHHDSVAEVACTCGTPEASIDGCASACCVSGEGNPEKSECACAPIEIND